MFRPKLEEVARSLRELHSEELRNMYSLPDIRVIKSRRVRWAEHVARM